MSSDYILTLVTQTGEKQITRSLFVADEEDARRALRCAVDVDDGNILQYAYVSVVTKKYARAINWKSF